MVEEEKEMGRAHRRATQGATRAEIADAALRT